MLAPMGGTACAPKSTSHLPLYAGEVLRSQGIATFMAGHCQLHMVLQLPRYAV